jgi:hypothetical protein
VEKYFQGKRLASKGRALPSLLLVQVCVQKKVVDSWNVERNSKFKKTTSSFHSGANPLIFGGSFPRAIGKGVCSSAQPKQGSRTPQKLRCVFATPISPSRSKRPFNTARSRKRDFGVQRKYKDHFLRRMAAPVAGDGREASVGHAVVPVESATHSFITAQLQNLQLALESKLAALETSLTSQIGKLESRISALEATSLASISPPQTSRSSSSLISTKRVQYL